LPLVRADSAGAETRSADDGRGGVQSLGNIALLTRKKLQWDPASLQITNVPEANAYLKRNYRDGWGV
jgi:hypothetical protein